MVKRYEPSDEEFREAIRESMSVTPEEMREVMISTARYGKGPHLDPCEVNDPVRTYDHTGYSPQVVRRSYQQSWDEWVLCRPDNLRRRKARREWMRKAYDVDEDPYEPSTWMLDSMKVMNMVDDAFGRQHGKSMSGPPWGNPPGYNWMLLKVDVPMRRPREVRVRPYRRRSR
jgi:hypothetical protein